MMNYKFYVFSNKGVEQNLTLEEAVKVYKETNTANGYKALGITKDGFYSCDLINNNGKNKANKISTDYTAMSNFRDDKFTIDTINELKEQFKGSISLQ